MEGTIQILKQCLTGMNMSDSPQVQIFDLLPNRFAEWSRAAWALQLESLGAGQRETLPYSYTAYSLDAAECDAMRAASKGRAMKDLHIVMTNWQLFFHNAALCQEWWDSSADAGSKTRPASSFDQPIPSLCSLTVADGELKPLGMS